MTAQPLRPLIVDPSSIAPVFSFNTGEVTSAGQVYNPGVPDIPGQLSEDWAVSAWGKEEYIDPTLTLPLGPFGADPTYGMPEYTWETPDLKTVFSVTPNATVGNIFDLYSANGDLMPSGGGGACVFLSSKTFVPVSMNQVINYSVDAKVAQATGTTSDGFATAESGFILHYDFGGIDYTLFLQYVMADARNQHMGAYASTKGNTVIYSPHDPTAPWLSFNQDGGGLHHLSYNLNTGVVEAAAYMSTTTSQSLINLDNMDNWTLTGYYVGSEVETTGGDIGLGIDVAKINIDAVSGTTFGLNDVAASHKGVYSIVTGMDGELVAPTEGGAVSVTANGPDTISGGIGNLTVKGGASALVVNAGNGTTYVSTLGSLNFEASEGDATISAGGYIIAKGGMGDLFVSGGYGASKVFCGSGATTVTDQGTVSVWGGSGTLRATAGKGGHSALYAGSGNATLTGGGAFDTVLGGAGSCTIVGAPDDVLAAGSGSSLITGAARDTIFGGGQATIQGGSSNLIIAGTSTETITGGGGSTIIWTNSKQGDLVNAGPGNVLVAGLGSSGADTINAGEGNDTIYAGPVACWVSGGSGAALVVLQNSDHFTGSSGSATIFGDGQNTVSGGSGTLTGVFSGSGNEFDFGSGSATLWNKGSDSTYVFNEKLPGLDILSHFDFSSDEMRFAGFSGDPIATEVAGHGGVIITLTNGAEISILDAVHFTGT